MKILPDPFNSEYLEMDGVKENKSVLWFPHFKQKRGRQSVGIFILRSGQIPRLLRENH